MIFVEYLQFWSILFWVEKGIKKKKNPKHRITEFEKWKVLFRKKKETKFMGCFYFPLNIKIALLSSKGKMYWLTTYTVYFID